MELSDRTKQVKRLRNIFGIISFILWLGTLIFFVCGVFRYLATNNAEETEKAVEVILSQETKNLLMSISTTAVIGIIAAIVIKDKIRTFIWMLAVIIGTILYKEIAMYIVLAIWCIDEYIIHALYKKYKNLVMINKEIDRR